jgi:hypothetical protein
LVRAEHPEALVMLFETNHLKAPSDYFKRPQSKRLVID